MSKYFIEFSTFPILILYCYILRFNNWIHLTGRWSACIKPAASREHPRSRLCGKACNILLSATFATPLAAHKTGNAQ